MKRAAALPAVLVALTLASALAVGGSFVSRQRASAARFANRGLELLPRAERALIDAVAAWDSAGRAGQPVGQTIQFPPLTDSDVLTEVWITRTSVAQFWLVAQAANTSRPVLRRRIGLRVVVSGGIPKPVPERPWTDLP